MRIITTILFVLFSFSVFSQGLTDFEKLILNEGTENINKHPDALQFFDLTIEEWELIASKPFLVQLEKRFDLTIEEVKSIYFTVQKYNSDLSSSSIEYMIQNFVEGRSVGYVKKKLRLLIETSCTKLTLHISIELFASKSSSR